MKSASLIDSGALTSNQRAKKSRGGPCPDWLARHWANQPARLKIVSGIVLVLLIVAISVSLTLADATADANAVEEPTLEESIDLDSMLATLQSLDDIGADNGGTREVGAGYNASIDWLQAEVEALLDADPDMQVWVQTFEVDGWEAEGTPEFYSSDETFSYDEEFGVLTYSGGGLVSAAAASVAGNYGCYEDDYTAGEHNDTVVIVQRGNCTFLEKVELVVANGGLAAVIYNEGDSDDRLDLYSGTVGEQAAVPVLATTFSLGEDLAALAAEGGLELTINVTVLSEVEVTSNLFAQPSMGSTDSVIVVGSHLDSVEAGPGVNDNGSGSAFNLETLTRFLELYAGSRSGEVVNAVRFAWWGAEELGLLGSTAYVESLSADELAALACNLNYDMLGSPNGARLVYDGASYDGAGSAYLQDLFNSALDSLDLTYEATEFDGRSDYGPFLDAGVPAGGLFSGAEDIKDEDGRELFGGLANTAYDPCYHEACDTYENVDADLLLELGRAGAIALEALVTTEDLQEVLAAGPTRRLRRLSSPARPGPHSARSARASEAR